MITAARVVQQLLVDLGLGVLGGTTGSWPIYKGYKPNTPDDCIVVYNSGAEMDGRIQSTGAEITHPAIQILIRSATDDAAESKGLAIQDVLQDIRRELVTVSSTTYLIQGIHRRTDLTPIGEEEKSRRRLFTINYVLTFGEN